MSLRNFVGTPNITAIKIKGGGTIGVSAGDQIRILPHGGYRGNFMVLSATTSANDVRRFILSALPDCQVAILNYGIIPRRDIESVFEYKG